MRNIDKNGQENGEKSTNVSKEWRKNEVKKRTKNGGKFSKNDEKNGEKLAWKLQKPTKKGQIMAKNWKMWRKIDHNIQVNGKKLKKMAEKLPKLRGKLKSKKG